MQRKLFLGSKLPNPQSIPLNLCLVVLMSIVGVWGQSAPPASVLMYHNDPQGTGQNLQETVLTPKNVNSNTFGSLFTHNLDGYVFAQPLYLPNVDIPGRGIHNVVYVATEHDTVYAFDADSNRGSNSIPLWETSFINPAAGITTIPSSVYGFGDPPEFGVTGTPVIDPDTGTLYVVAKMRNTALTPIRYYVRLYALDVATGENKLASPIDISGAVAGTGAGSTNGNLVFDPQYEAQRCGLLLHDGVIYLAFCSHNDGGPYHGCVVGYDA